MTNLDGLCQGGPEGEKYPKTTWTGKATKKTNKKEVWKSLVRASSSAQPTEEKKEKRKKGQKFWRMKIGIFLGKRQNCLENFSEIGGNRKMRHCLRGIDAPYETIDEFFETQESRAAATKADHSSGDSETNELSIIIQEKANAKITNMLQGLR